MGETSHQRLQIPRCEVCVENRPQKEAWYFYGWFESVIRKEVYRCFAYKNSYR